MFDLTISAPTENERTVMGMAEYIEREAAIESIMGETPDAHYPQWYSDKIKAIPASDVAPVHRWIPVAERLPEKNKEVVGWYKDNPFSPFRYGIVSWNGHGWVFTYAQRYVDAVTYWIPLPEPPKEETP